MLVCHNCDNAACVRSDHLFLGTFIDNFADMKAKKRSATGDKNGSRIHPELIPRGEDHHNSKLTVDKVLDAWDLHDAGLSSAEIGRRFSVSGAAIGDVFAGKTWKHVTRNPATGARTTAHADYAASCVAAEMEVK